MSIPIELIYHYPWLPSLEKLFSQVASKPPSEFVSSVFKDEYCEEIQERLIEFFKAAFENLESVSYYKIDIGNIYFYLMIKILLFSLNNKKITNKIGNLYSKINYNDLIKENDYNIYSICEDLNLDVIYNKDPWEYGISIFRDQQEIYKTHFRIHYIDYLKLASNLHDEYRRLVNNALKDGYLYIKKRSLLRLIQEYVRKKIDLDDNKDLADSLIKELMEIKEFKQIFEDISSQWELKKEEFEYTFKIDFKEGLDISDIFPPCITEILSKAQEGQNLIHIERLFSVFFMHALNYPVEKIIDIFSTMPDFNREKTAYQVNFAKKKAYTPHKCSTLKSLNLCRAEKDKYKICLEGYYSKKDDIQKNLTHPLFYVQLRKYRESRKKNINDNQEIKTSNERK